MKVCDWNFVFAQKNSSVWLICFSFNIFKLLVNYAPGKKHESVMLVFENKLGLNIFIQTIILFGLMKHARFRKKYHVSLKGNDIWVQPLDITS